MRSIIILILLSFMINSWASTESGGVRGAVEGIISNTATGTMAKLKAFMAEGHDNVDIVQEFIVKHGKIKDVECLVNHESAVFFGIVCHVTYEDHNSGNSWTFYIFKDGDKYVGTRLELSNMLGRKDQCLKNVTISTGITKGLEFEKTEC